MAIPSHVLRHDLPILLGSCVLIGSVGGFLAALIGIVREKRGGDCGNGCPCG